MDKAWTHLKDPITRAQKADPTKMFQPEGPKKRKSAVRTPLEIDKKTGQCNYDKKTTTSHRCLETIELDRVEKYHPAEINCLDTHLDIERSKSKFERRKKSLGCLFVFVSFMLICITNNVNCLAE